MKQNSLTKVFNFNPANQQIRVEVIKNEPWFVAKDVCDVLGIQNSRDSINKMLDDDEKGVAKIYTLGGTQDMTVVSESGLYNLIFRSNKPEARAFRKWVTSEVLPAIRQTGNYTSSAMHYVPASNRELALSFQNLAFRELMNVESTRTRKRLAGLIDFFVSQINN